MRGLGALIGECAAGQVVAGPRKKMAALPPPFTPIKRLACLWQKGALGKEPHRPQLEGPFPCQTKGSGAVLFVLAPQAALGLDPNLHLPPRRFGVGARVEAFTGDGLRDGWSPGEVVGLNYREPDWAADQIAPYQIRLDEGGELIFAPMDEDRVVRLE